MSARSTDSPAVEAAAMPLTEASNLSHLLAARLAATPEHTAYRQYDGSRWFTMTWAEVAREVARWQAALRAAGLSPGDRVALCLRNRIEWVLLDQAAIGLGLVTVPLYFDDRAENMAWCLNDSGARFLLLENAAQWQGLRGQVRTVENVVCLGGGMPDDPRVQRLADWAPPGQHTLVRSSAAPQELATIVYTSGTTGRPKGVMLSHRNILSNVIACSKVVELTPQDVSVSFLPLSHMFERTVGYYLNMYRGVQVAFARSISQLAEDLRIHKPTILVAVPRVFERIWSAMQQALPPGSPRRRLLDKAIEVGWRRFRGEAGWQDRLLWPVLEALVAHRIHERLGGRVRAISVGGAAFAADLARVFVGLGLNILQGYGLTEAAPVLTTNRPEDNDPLSVGRPIEGVELRCAENGELLARGPNVMLGYWNDPEATRAAIDADGWLHTGDLARIRDGRVYITGRIKDIIVLSNGEKVPPEDAEQAILGDPVFEHAMLVGEGRPYLGLVCVSKVTDLEELCRRANAQLHAFPGYARVRYIARVPGPWTVENGLLTPTLKLKRKEVERRFAREIETMFAGPSPCGAAK
ncbi:MAG TPA: AMP-dependent synthetase/ligase [Burkholderiales bacterium]